MNDQHYPLPFLKETSRDLKLETREDAVAIRVIPNFISLQTALKTVVVEEEEEEMKLIQTPMKTMPRMEEIPRLLRRHLTLGLDLVPIPLLILPSPLVQDQPQPQHLLGNTFTLPTRIKN